MAVWKTQNNRDAKQISGCQWLGVWESLTTKERHNGIFWEMKLFCTLMVVWLYDSMHLLKLRTVTEWICFVSVPSQDFMYGNPMWSDLRYTRIIMSLGPKFMLIYWYIVPRLQKWWQCKPQTCVIRFVIINLQETVTYFQLDPSVRPKVFLATYLC